MTRPNRSCVCHWRIGEAKGWRGRRDDLVADIKTHGLRLPIWLHTDGSILDGRNRYRACLEAGIEPRYQVWDGKGYESDFVYSLNAWRLCPSNRTPRWGKFAPPGPRLVLNLGINDTEVVFHHSSPSSRGNML
jgi:hypothetical protein